MYLIYAVPDYLLLDPGQRDPCCPSSSSSRFYITCVLQVFFGYLVAVILVQGNYGLKILEIQTKTSTDNDSGRYYISSLHEVYDHLHPRPGMNGAIVAEICDSSLYCCNAGELDTDRDDFNKGHVDVFYGRQIGECEGWELGEGPALMIVTHQGMDAWKGDWTRCNISLAQ